MRYPFLIINCAFSVAVAVGASPNYDDHIRPIFENSCTNCHNPDKQKGDLDLTSYSAAMRGGSGGKFAEPGEGGDSKMYGVITHTLKPKMPPKGEKLEKKEADLIRAWIDGGLLENKSGKPQKKKKPAFALSSPSGGASSGKPDKISMPQHLLLEPVVITTRPSAVADMATSPWAPLLAITGQRQVLIYNTDSLRLEAVLPFDHGQPETLSFHPSGKYLLAGGGIGGKSGTTVTWEIETGKAVLRAGKDFDSVIAASLRADLGGVSLGGPGKRVKLWDTAADEQLASIKKHTDWVTQLAYSPDGVLLASGGRGGGVYIWEGETGNEFHNLRGHKAGITDLVWRSDSNLLATASGDGSVLVWEMNNGKQVKKIVAHGGGVLSLDWTKDGHLVSSGRDMKVKIWKPDFNILKELPTSKKMITQVAFSHDGKRVCAANWSGQISVWDVATAKQIGTLASNPPTIAARIKWIQNDILTLPAKVVASEKVVQATAVQQVAAKAVLTKVETDHRTADAKYKQLVAERTKLDGQLKVVYAEGDALGKQREQKQTELTKARDMLNKHNAALASMRKEHQQVENEVKQMTEHEKSLVANEDKVRMAAEAKPEDVQLKEIATKAKADLDAHRHQLGLKRGLSQQKSTALAQLTNQQKGPGNQLAAANKGWTDINGKWTAYQAKRKPLQDKRNGMNKPIVDTQNLVKSLDPKVKAAREGFTKADAAQKKAATDLDQMKKQKGYRVSGLKHWQAAAINTEAIHLAQEAADFTAKQNGNMDAFTALAAEIQQLKDPAKLAEKSRELRKLRKAIDQAAPAVLGKSREATAKKSAYLRSVVAPAHK